MDSNYCIFCEKHIAMSCQNQAYCSAACKAADHGTPIASCSDWSSGKDIDRDDSTKSRDFIRAWTMDVHRVSSPAPSQNKGINSHCALKQPALLTKPLARQPLTRLNFEPHHPVRTVASHIPSRSTPNATPTASIANSSSTRSSFPYPITPDTTKMHPLPVAGRGRSAMPHPKSAPRRCSNALPQHIAQAGSMRAAC